MPKCSARAAQPPPMTPVPLNVPSVIQYQRFRPIGFGSHDSPDLLEVDRERFRRPREDGAGEFWEVDAFAKDLAAHGGTPEAVAEVCIDMSQAFIAGTAESLPNAQITFDKFHVVKLIKTATSADT